MVDTTVYDNIDRDIVVVNKDTLTLKLERCENFHNASNSAFGLGGIAISLLTSGYLTDTFRSVGPIPGETIRATFLATGLVCGAVAVKSAINWWRLRSNHKPNNVVASLMVNPIHQISQNQSLAKKKTKRAISK